MDFIHRNEVSDLIDMDTLPVLKYLGIIDENLVGFCENQDIHH